MLLIEALFLVDIPLQITSGNIYNVKSIIAEMNMPMIRGKAIDTTTYYDNNYIFLPMDIPLMRL
jgi:hypothetical protein